MSDERIDLTQFDGVTPGPWTHNPLIGTMVSGVRAGEDARESAFNGNDPDYQALFHIPEMIAELKRCYKLLDDANDAMSRYGDEEEHQDIDNVCDAYEAVCNALAGQGRW
jgi:hypothetical protein